MLAFRLPRLPHWVPLVLLGGLPAHAGAAEQFFPVLLDSGTHWFSFLEDHELRATQPQAPGARSSSLQVLRKLQAHEEALEQGSAAADAYDSNSMEALEQLSRLLRDSGRHAEAYERLEQHYFLARVTHGLHHASHIPILQALAELAQLMGDSLRAHDLREAQLNLSLRVFDEDDPGRIDAWLQWADWQLQCYLESTATPWLTQGLEQNPWFNPYFLESDTHYRRALQKFTWHERLPAATMKALLQAMRSWQTLHIVAARRQSGLAHVHAAGHSQLATGGLLHAPQSWIGHVTETMRRTMHEEPGRQGPEPELRVAQLVLLGDWLHAIALPEQATSTYLEAWELADASGLSDARAELLLGPGLPVPDPEEWYRSKRGIASFSGHIDTEVTLDAQGNVRNIVVIDAGAATASTTRALQRHIARSRFRPVYGKPQADKVIRLRYYHD